MAIKVLNNYPQVEFMIFKKVCKTLEQLYIYIYILRSLIKNREIPVEILLRFAQVLPFSLALRL